MIFQNLSYPAGWIIYCQDQTVFYSYDTMQTMHVLAFYVGFTVFNI